MCATFSDDDVGKRVVNANGEEVGMVTAVEHGTAHVEPDPGITDSLKATLGWEDRSEDAYPLQDEAVDRVTDDEIRLQGELGGPDAGGGSITAGEAGTTAEATDRGPGETGRGVVADEDATDTDAGADRPREETGSVGRDVETTEGRPRDDEGALGTDVGEDADAMETEDDELHDTEPGEDESGVADTDIGVDDDDRDRDRP